jgi:hypothetical protein
MGLKDTERTVFIWICECLLDHCGAVDLGLRVKRIVVLALGADDKVQFREVAEAILAVARLAAVLPQQMSVSEALKH